MKKYESLYLKSKEQVKDKTFAHFQYVRIGAELDFSSPFRPLAEMATPERWESLEKNEDGGRRFPMGNLEILKSYLNQTFLRLQVEGKVLVSRDSSWSCFNTGLQEKTYGDDIYAFFQKNANGEGNQDWFFKGFWSEPNAMKARMLDGFADKPQVAEYYSAENYKDLFFNLEYRTIVVSDHIVEDNEPRLPVQLRGNRFLARNAIKGAVDGLYAKLRRNYKLAVPHWYENRIQLLLPLYITDFQKADVALIAERNDDQKCYLIRTILTMDQAYQDARVICRPDSDWLQV